MQIKPFFRTLTIIHSSLVLGLVLFCAIAYFQSDGFTVSMENEFDIFIYVVPLIGMAGYFGSQYVFKNLLNTIKSSDDLGIKLGKYRTASLIKFAILEAPAILALIAFYMTKNALYFVISVCLILYLFIQRPTVQRMKNDLPLNLEEIKQFDTLKT